MREESIKVKIGLSESEYFKEGDVLTLKQADELFKKHDVRNLDGTYEKVKFDISIDNNIVYGGRYDLGCEERGLIGHLEKSCESIKSMNENGLTSKEDMKYLNNLQEKIIPEIKEIIYENGLTTKDDINKFDFFETTKDIKLEDGSLIRKGTEFLIDSCKDNKYELHFEENSNNIYNNEFGDNYKFTFDDIRDFAVPTQYSINEYEKNNIKNENINYEENQYYEEKQFIKAEKLYDNYIDNADVRMEENYSIKDIKFLLKQHEEWLISNGQRGEKLDLSNKDLQGMKFLNADLRNANFKNADLRNCVIYADLRNANLEGTKIENTKFIGSNLGNVRIESNKLNKIEKQLNSESEKHKWAFNGLKTNKKEREIGRE
ncbi:pentapeptide repeat-containing protein [Clostridium botulinum]|uniref:LPD25 domain-containing protein n=1 Tax=Clostridium cagae TaxID=2080751 RepID=UPI0013C5A8D3|nr:pentapeptide repeat-containing protein [Clostridium botulinum]NFI64769.1 pentapeptide repeat-containing protein [Clostridium botulinum]NFJ45641.1 pentapeptide repeat-containing protein [Clostridium botulinum]NFJ49232.1 pentapeptide repeat-containing protein [Clostridium botulinum]NFK26930.1 pentapeptide repeat-containing protein [Clostridium botulinum]